MSLNAYRRTQTVAESPRQVEYRLFTNVTAALIDAQRSGLTGPALVTVLDWNRRLWSELASDCSVPGNRLPMALRAQIVSLSIWVSRYSTEVARGHGEIDALIDVNKSILEGLSARADAPPPAAAEVAMAATA